MKEKWVIAAPPESAVRHLVSTLHCHPATARALVNRGITDPLQAKSFWDAPLGNLRPPFDIKDMSTAVQRIGQALLEGQQILIFGDYDVDGITSTTILYDFLKLAGGRVSYYIPHRIHEGYGMRARHIREVAIAGGIKLIITVDCGIGSHEAVLAASASGIDVIVTDHHEPSDTLPLAHAVINPKREDCGAGFQYLAGVGVAFCLLASLRRHLRCIGFKWPNGCEPNLKSYLDLVAVGTIADMVPLTADNRILSKHGLHILNACPNIGLKALADMVGINKRQIDAEDIAFRVAPRINAAGRMDHAMNAVRLLSTSDPNEARQISAALGQLNSDRQVTEQKILVQIQAHLENHPHLLEKNAIILAQEGWHIGVLGIVAARLVRTYHLPTILISLSNGVGKGSGRSIPGFDLHGALINCKEALNGFGGHAQAIGLEIEASKLDCFIDLFHRGISDADAKKLFAQPVLIDATLRFDEIDARLAAEIEQMQPFGTGNAEPLFLSRNLKILNPTVIGGGVHRRLQLLQENRNRRITFKAIEFNFSKSLPPDGNLEWAAFRVRRNTWGGKDSVELFLETY